MVYKQKTVPVDDDFFLILMAAVRYSLGRRTYMPSTVCQWIITHCSNMFDTVDIDNMLRDIDSARDLGDKTDAEWWGKLKAFLLAERVDAQPLEKQKVAEALRICSAQNAHDVTECDECPYFGRKHCVTALLRDSLKTIEQ